MSDSETIKVFGESGFEDPTASDLEKLADRSPSVTKAEDTQQSGDDATYSAREYFTPPEDPEQLLSLLEKSETHQACVSAKSRGVAGHGFDIVPHRSVTADDAGDVPDELTEFWHTGTFQLGPGAIHASANEVLESAWNDLEAVGYLSIEILANPMDGTPTGLAHVPSKDIRKRRDKPGYVELNGTGEPPSYYAPAGARYDEDDPTFVDAETGEVADSANGVETVANELIVIRNYSALAPHYGLPDIIPGVKTLAGDLAAREYTRSWFESDTMPRFAVVVSGGELTDNSWKQLKQTFKNLQQDGNSHRGVLIESTNTVETQLGESTGADITIEPLTQMSENDAGFTEYRDNNEHYILQAHNVPPVVAGRTQDVNRSTAKSQRVNFAQEVIAPKQERFASRLYQVIHKQAFGIEKWTLDFSLVGGTNELRESKVLSNKASAVQTLGKVMSKDEIRSDVFNLDPLDDGTETLNDENAPDIAPDQQPPDTQPSDSQSDEQTEAMVEKASDWDEGDVVETEDGTIGVVTDIYTDDFGSYSEQGETVEVAEGETVYVVALASGGFGYFSASELTEGQIPEDEQADTDDLGEEKRAELAKVDTEFDLPDGWSRLTALDAWQSMNASWRGCYATMSDEGVNAKRFCSSFKDFILQTELWR